jgi:hypothetical protein
MSKGSLAFRLRPRLLSSHFTQILRHKASLARIGRRCAGRRGARSRKKLWSANRILIMNRTRQFSTKQLLYTIKSNKTLCICLLLIRTRQTIRTRYTRTGTHTSIRTRGRPHILISHFAYSCIVYLSYLRRRTRRSLRSGDSDMNRF